MPGLLLLPYPASTTLHLGGHFSTSLVKKTTKKTNKETKQKKRHLNSSRGNLTLSLPGLDDKSLRIQKNRSCSRSSASTQEKQKGRRKEHKVKTMSKQGRSQIHCGEFLTECTSRSTASQHVLLFISRLRSIAK